MAGGGGGPEAELMSQSEPLSPARKVVFSKQELSNLSFQIGKERNPPLPGQNGVWQGKELLLPLLFLKSIFIGICWFTMSC